MNGFVPVAGRSALSADPAENLFAQDLPVGGDDAGEGHVVDPEHHVAQRQQRQDAVLPQRADILQHALQAKQVDDDQVACDDGDVKDQELCRILQRAGANLLQLALQNRVVPEEADKQHRRLLVRADEQRQKADRRIDHGRGRVAVLDHHHNQHHPRQGRHGVGGDRDDGQQHQQQAQRRGDAPHRHLRTFLNQAITSLKNPAFSSS